MKKCVSLLLFILLLMSQSICFAQSVFLDGSTPLTLTISPSIPASKEPAREFEIAITSPEYQRLQTWLSDNATGWGRAEHRWQAPYVVVSKGLRLEFSGVLVVLKINMDGKPVTLSRMGKGELVKIFANFINRP